MPGDVSLSKPAGEPGRLTIVGTGFMVAGQVTPESVTAMKTADRLLHLVSDSATARWLETLNPRTESLYDAYAEGRPRRDSYEEMIQRILAPVRGGLSVCAAFYGHPGIFVFPSHEAIRRAREEGHAARMLPGISAEDRLFADLRLDPSVHGCRSYEATSFLARSAPVDPTTGLILWQVGAIGVTTYYNRLVWRTEGLRYLVEALQPHYPEDHEVIVYTASTLPVAGSEIHRLPLGRLPGLQVSVASTLYVPPARVAAADRASVERLGLTEARGEAC